MAYFNSPYTLTLSGSGSWVDVDLSAYLPAGATGAVIHCVANTVTIGARKNGSTDNRTRALAGYNTIIIGCDANRVIELYSSDTGNSTFYLMGYFTTEASFETNAIDCSITSGGGWWEMDVSGVVPSGGKFAIIEIDCSGATTGYAFRKNGSTDNRTTSWGSLKNWCLMPLDANRIGEYYTEGGTAMKMWYHGYINMGNALTNGTDHDISATGAWTDEDISSDVTDATAAWAVMEIEDGYQYSLRPDGSSFTGTQSQYASGKQYTLVGLNPATQIIEAYQNTDTAYSYLLGWVISPVTVTKTLSIDAVCQKGRTKTTSMDAVLIEIGVELPIDALLTDTDKTVTTSLDAITIPPSVDIALDALLYSQNVRTASLDAYITDQNVATVSLDSLLQKARYKTPSIDAGLSATKYRYVQMDAMFENVEMTGASELEMEASGAGHVTRYMSGAADFKLEAEGAVWRTALLVGSADIELTAEGYEGIRGEADLELQASGSIEFGKVMSGSADLKLQATATALSTILATGSAQFALDAPGGTLVNTTVSATGGTTRLGLDSSGSMTIGYVITGDADLGLDTSTGNTILPGWVMVGEVEIGLRTEGHMSAYDVQGTFEILVLNPETAALSTYTNFGFNSFCQYGSAYLGAKGADIVSLTGSKDDNTDIDAYITTPTFDISQGSMRSLIDMWLVGRSSGKLISTFEWDEKYIAKDVIRHLRNTVDESRVTLPRGMRGRMFNIKIENVDGSDFDLSSIRILGVPLGPKRSR